MNLVVFHTSCLFLYNLASHLVNPKHWVPAYEQVATLKPGDMVVVAVLDFFLSLESRQSQISTDIRQPFYYLAQDTVRYLTRESGEDQGNLQKSITVINERAVICPFLFLVTSQVEPSTYFLVVFDFFQEKVLILGRRGLSGPDFHKAYGEWESWNGNTLWRKIYRALTQAGLGELETMTEPTIYETDLIQVSNSMPLLILKPNLFILLFLAQFSFRSWNFRVCSASAQW